MLPVETVCAACEGHQEPLPHRELQLFRVCDDQHVWAGQPRAEVVQVDLGVIGHQTDTDVGQSVSVLPTGRSGVK